MLAPDFETNMPKAAQVKSLILTKENQNMDAQDDAALWNQLRNGNKRAFDIIYEGYVQVLFQFGSYITKDHYLLEEVIQELFVDIWENRERLGTTHHIKYYLLKSIKRRIIRSGKKESMFIKNIFPEKQFLFEINQNTEIIDAEIEQHEATIQRLQSALLKLTNKQREIIYLRFYEKMTFEDISDILSISLKSTYNLLSRTIDILRQYVIAILALLTIFSTPFS